MTTSQFQPIRAPFRRLLAVAGGIAGAVIGPTGLYLHARAAVARLDGRGPGSVDRTVDWSTMMSRLTANRYGWLAIALAFFVTFALMHPLIRWLEARAALPRRPFYLRAAAAGVLLGFGATAILTLLFVLGSLVVGATGPSSEVTALQLPALTMGGAFFGSIAALVAPFLFLPYLILFGIPLGAATGWAIRRWTGAPESHEES